MVLLSQVLRVCAYQFVLAATVAVAWCAVAGLDAVPALLLGGVIAIVPSLAQGGLMALLSGNPDPRSALATFYAGFMMKLVLTILLFIVAIALLRVDFTPLITAYLAALAGYWIALLRVTPVNRGRLDTMARR